MAFSTKSPMALVVLFQFFSSTLAQNGTLFTPEAMLSAPRRRSALPNPVGTLALYTLPEYSFTEHKTTRGLYVTDLINGSSWQFSNSSAVSNSIWLGDGNKIIWLVSGDDSSTSFAVSDAATLGEE